MRGLGAVPYCVFKASVFSCSLTLQTAAPLHVARQRNTQNHRSFQRSLYYPNMQTAEALWQKSPSGLVPTVYLLSEGLCSMTDQL